MCLKIIYFKKSNYINYKLIVKNIINTKNVKLEKELFTFRI